MIVRTWFSTTRASRGFLRVLVATLATARFTLAYSAERLPSAPPANVLNELRYKLANESFVITIHSADAEPLTVRQDGRDLLISFASATPPFDASDLQRGAVAWLESVSVGYDDVLLRLAKGVDVHIERNEPTLTLRFASSKDAPVEAQGIVSQAGDGTGALRLQLLGAGLLLRTQKLTQARARYTELRASMPGKPEPVVGLAAVEYQVGRWRRSLELYREAAALGGDDEYLAATLREIESSQASRARAGVEHRTSRGGNLDAPITLTVGHARGFARIDDAWRIGVDAETATARTDAVRRVSGSVQSFSGARNRVSLSAQHDHLDGVTTVGSLFFGGGTAGLGLSQRRPGDTGATDLVLEWQRPNWDYLEGIIDGALRDRLAIVRTQRLRGTLSGRIELGYNGYHRREDRDLGRSASLAAELRIEELAGVLGLVATYSVEGEYINRRSSRQTQVGETFAPLPLVNREVHKVTIGYARSNGDRWAGGATVFDGYVGFGSDRYGLSGSIAAATLSYALGEQEIQLWSNYVRNVGRSRAIATAIGGFVSIGF